MSVPAGTMERPGLESLLAYAREGDTLAVVRLDRLGRSLGELLTTVAMLKERGIALLSLEERIDTNSAAGELVVHVFGAIAHFERRLIAERIAKGVPVDDETWRELTVAARGVNVLVEAPAARA